MSARGHLATSERRGRESASCHQQTLKRALSSAHRRTQDFRSIHQVIELLLKPGNVALGAPEIRSQFLDGALLLRVRHVGRLGKIRKLPLAVCHAILAPREGGPQLIDSRHVAVCSAFANSASLQTRAHHATQERPLSRPRPVDVPAVSTDRIVSFNSAQGGYA
jgi:hypothetical protein